MENKNYAILRVNKIKTGSGMYHCYCHNMRTEEVENADPNLSQYNVDVQDMLNGRTYNDVFNETITNLKSKQTMSSVRKNAVRGFEVICRFSREAEPNLDKDAWIKKNMDWLNEKFNPPGGVMRYKNEYGEMVEEPANNVKSIVVHNDEGCMHIHAFVVPIDDKGRLNASYYTGHPYQLRNMQNEYADNMKEFGLSRGEYKSIATPESLRKYYNNINRSVKSELPEVLPGETAEEYRQRANECYQVEKSNHNNDIVKMKQNVIKAHSGMTLAKEESQKQKKDNEHIKKELARALGKEEPEEGDLHEAREIIRENRHFKEAVENHPDKEKTEEIKNNYYEMIHWNKKRKRKRRREKNQQKNQE